MDMLKTFLEIKVGKEGIPLDENPNRGGDYLKVESTFLNQERKK
ncbi:hypothetical protein [Candidatus Midichloria mitochondrii]|nr:hypothetical protein [Candidatus Midichloria mitochondrii]